MRNDLSESVALVLRALVLAGILPTAIATPERPDKVNRGG